MDINLTTPALLFPAVSLLLLTYTNRFLSLAGGIRRLHAEYQAKQDPSHLAQISYLRRRIRMVRNMQFAGVSSLLLCTVCMFLLFCGLVMVGEVIFCAAMLAMIYSQVVSLMEIHISVKALDLHLQDIEEPERTE